MTSAAKAGMCRNSATKYLKNPEPKPPVSRSWRTRKDPLAGMWPEAEAMLAEAPELEAKALFEYLIAKHPGVSAGSMRTFQRRVRTWKLEHGPDKEVFFAQEHSPGQWMQADWMALAKLGITIAGQRLGGLLCHCVLPYSNWQWGVRCALGESLLSLQTALNASFWRLGAAPLGLQTDHTSAATHRLSRNGDRRELNQGFLDTCAHFGLKARTINLDSPHENGDCESLHGHLRRRIRQHLLLRGHSDFEDDAQLDAFLAEVFTAANARQNVVSRLAEEMAVMRELPKTMLPDYEQLECRVSRESTIRVKKAVYSVPARLIGLRVRVRVNERSVSVYHDSTKLFETERLRVAGATRIQWRHMINHLMRKPGAFARWRHREAMFPSALWRACYDSLERARGAEGADREYLRLLKLAADQGQAGVENALEELLGAPPWRHPPMGIGLAEVQERLGLYGELAAEAQQRQQPLQPCLDAYDRLLAGATAEVSNEF